MYIKVENAVKKYGAGENTIYALDHASLELEKGGICVILGPSGSGKSTLLNLLGGLDSADEGTVTVDGCELTKYSKKQLGEYRRVKVGIVFQTYNLIDELTVRENVRVAWNSRSISTSCLMSSGSQSTNLIFRRSFRADSSKGARSRERW